ncbi:DUF11 domain-containing protein [Leptolyngbya sp. KIOST-1]|uniref:DUF11 domain-containing protein n=1 Tax=Leptolyngbya sp. KIOST-1 TaxID=1229172 RepID=UPI0018CFC88C|nr:DUF11 domain-containing protein [Leptolyngbya sp. KIOST-1]
MVLPFPTARLAGLVAGVVLALVGVLGGATPAYAQLAAPVSVDSLITNNEPAIRADFPGTPFTTPCNPAAFPGCDALGATSNLSFGAGTNVVLEAVIAAGNRFEPAADLLPPVGLAQQIVFRRNLGAGLPNRELLFFEQLNINLPTIELNPGQVSGIEEAMLSRIINRGIDNVFNNQLEVVPPATTGAETSNNIERIDYLITAPGITVPVEQQGDVGFLILERGGNDAFKIAAITAVDGAGNPTAYGPLINVGAGTWGNSTDVNISTAVLRRDDLASVVPPLFRPSHLVGPQNVQGIFFPINSLVQAPENTQPIFGYSLFAADVTGVGPQLVDFTNTAFFPTTTDGTNFGGLDLIAGGFGLIRRAAPPPVGVGALALVKRVTNLFGAAPLPNFGQVVGDGAALTLLQNNGLGQGLDVITEPQVEPGNGIEYTVYFANSGVGPSNNVVLCDQIPAGLTFDPNAYGPGVGIQAIAPSSPAGPVVTYTNASDGDPGQFIAPGAALPPFCGVNQGNGAVVVNVGTVDSDQVGLIRFRATVN